MKCWTICTPRQSAVVFVAFISRANLLGVAGYDRVLAVSHLVQRTERFDLGCIPRILKFYIKSLLQIFYICSRDHLSFVFFGLGLIFLLFFFIGFPLFMRQRTCPQWSRFWSPPNPVSHFALKSHWDENGCESDQLRIRWFFPDSALFTFCCLVVNFFPGSTVDALSGPM